jgi:hypothetical protein
LKQKGQQELRLPLERSHGWRIPKKHELGKEHYIANLIGHIWGKVLLLQFGAESLSLILSIFYESFLLPPGFIPKNEEISAPPPIPLTIDDCRLLIGIYKPHEK